MQDSIQFQTLFFVSTLGMILMLSVVLFLIYFIQKRKIQFILKQQEDQRKFELLLSQSKSEITENNYKNIAWELHDNVGQLLGIASMQLKGTLSNDTGTNETKNLKQISEMISQAINEIRSLSHSLNSSVINNKGLLPAIIQDLERLQQVYPIELEITIDQDDILLNNDHEIFIFRIIQEFLMNSVKYSEAKKISFRSEYQNDTLIIFVADNGKGFDVTNEKNNSGLFNMKERASIINAKLKIHSEIGKGTELNLIYPINSNNV